MKQDHKLGLGIPTNQTFEQKVNAAIRMLLVMYTEEDMERCYEAGEDSKEEEINGDGETTFKEWLDKSQFNSIEGEAIELLKEVIEYLPNIDSLPLKTETGIGSITKKIHTYLTNKK